MYSSGMAKEMQIDEHFKKCPEQFQRMDCLRDLAAGIAHGFNNIFTTIVGCGNMMLMNIEDKEKLVSYIEQILKASERASAITNSLLAFSIGLKINPMPINLNEFIMNHVKTYVSEILSENITVELELCDDRLTVISDFFQIDRVMKILISNANDSMPYGGSIIIKTDAVRLKDWDREDKGLYALISVKDSGTGMDIRTKEKIFDPFFTTKDIGKGMGLGLSTAYGIIKQHNGYIRCLSEPNKGSTFEIYLPAVEQIEVMTQEAMRLTA